MSNSQPTVNTLMTTSPHTIGSDQTLAKAHVFMEEFEIRHLPVLRGGQLVGMLTERDLALIEALDGVDPSEVTVDEAMSPDVYAVEPGTALQEVLNTMATKKYGSAVVLEDRKVVGILTAVDVCAAFAKVLAERG